jgi:very-short-patch-repair endonuclease
MVHGQLRGRPRVFAVLSVADPRAESPMESILRVTMVDRGLPRPECQVDVFDADGQFIGRLDLAYRRARVGIEYEGDQHRERTAFRRDLARINAMQAAGWVIVRVTADDIRNPDKMIAQIRAALAARTP